MGNTIDESKEISNGGMSWLMHMRLVLSEIERLIREIERIDRERKELVKDCSSSMTDLQDKLDLKILDLRKEISCELKESRDDIGKIKEAVIAITIKVAIGAGLVTIVLTVLAQIFLKKWIG